MDPRESWRIEKINLFQKMMDNEDNSDIEPWTCKVCGWGPVSRLFAYLEHVLSHLRKNDFT